MKSRRIKTGLIVIAILGLCIILAHKYYSGRKPNIILITFDALRADHLGCYGYPKGTSPFLDSFSRDSLTFTNCITQSASTVPAVSAIFTGHYPYLDGVVTKDYTLGSRYMTIAEFLRQKGYQTFAIPGHFYVKKKFGFSRGFDYFLEDYTDRLNAGETLTRVINLFNNQVINNKFFLWIHIREPHAPYNPPQGYIDRFLQPADSRVKMSSGYQVHGVKMTLTQQGLNELIARYDGNIRYADDNLKKIFDYLAKRGFLKNSVVIITADHGECLGEQNLVDHNCLFYPVLHVPLIMKIPGCKGKSISYPVSSVDIFPTISDLLGYKKDISQLGLRGRSLLKERGITYLQYSEYPKAHSIIKGNWRLYENPKQNLKMLFNVTSDAQEKYNLAAKYANIYKLLYFDLQDILKTSHKDTADSIDEKSILNKKDIEQLKSLGYLN